MSATSKLDRKKRWQQRITRARNLQQQHPAAATLLRFYENVLEFQENAASRRDLDYDREAPLRDRLDIEAAISSFPELLTIAASCGPETLAQKSRALCAQSEREWRELLVSAIAGHDAASPVDVFFTRAVLQPIAEELQSKFRSENTYNHRVCPACGGLPQLSILRPEGEGVSRWLMCSFCLHEWLYRRLICPSCGEEDKERLPRYSSEQCRHVIVEGCDTCRKYLKAVDMSIDGHAEPLVDELALAVLDVWAGEHGYSKISLNLLGL